MMNSCHDESKILRFFKIYFACVDLNELTFLKMSQ